MSTSNHPFTTGLNQGLLRYQRCTGCGRAQTPTRLACSHCGSAALEWQDASGDGTVVAASVVSRAPSDEFRALAPYTLVLVDLIEGPCVMGHATAGIAIGDSVKAATVPHGDRRLLCFSPSRHGQGLAAARSTPEAISAFNGAEVDKWGRMVRTSGATVE